MKFVVSKNEWVKKTAYIFLQLPQGSKIGPHICLSSQILNSISQYSYYLVSQNFFSTYQCMSKITGRPASGQVSRLYCQSRPTILFTVQIWTTGSKFTVQSHDKVSPFCTSCIHPLKGQLHIRSCKKIQKKVAYVENSSYNLARCWQMRWWKRGWEKCGSFHLLPFVFNANVTHNSI